MGNFLRLAAMSPSIRLGDPKANGEQIRNYLEEAERAGVDLALFPELVLTGSSLGQLFLQEDFQDRVERALETLLLESKDLNLAFLLGYPAKVGQSLVSACALVQKGKIRARFYHQYFLPEEKRRLSALDPGPLDQAGLSTFRLGEAGPRIALSFAGDLDQVSWEAYRQAEVDLLLLPLAQANLGLDAPLRSAGAYLSATGTGLLLANLGRGESSAEALFGGETGLAEGGQWVVRGESLLEAASGLGASQKTCPGPGLLFYDFDLAQARARRRLTQTARADYLDDWGDLAILERADREDAGGKIPGDFYRYLDPQPLLAKSDREREAILRSQALALVQRMDALSTDQVWLGFSGGLDSCLAFLAARRAFLFSHRPLEGLHLVSMPAFGTGKRTRDNAQKLGQISHCDFREIPLQESLEAHFQAIGLDPTEANVAFENAQARERTQVLMDLANLHGGIMVGTGDLSEGALGWCTYGGDQLSHYQLNASLPKTQVRDLVAYEAKHLPALAPILEDILATPISPELLPAKEGTMVQQTEEILGPYALHDFFLYHVLYCKRPAQEILALAQASFGATYPKEILRGTLETFYRRLLQSQFKRQAMPDGVTIGKISLSPRTGLALPSDLPVGRWLESIREE